MRKGDAQLGLPQALYKGTKAAIEALTGVPEGAVAYATDDNEFGSYDGSTWTWGQSGGGATDWGDIGGTLSDQTDLQAALDAKLDDSQLEDTIANGVTTKAPSQNAVFDALALKQPLDSDLTSIAGLSPANDDIIQRKAGAWVNRTVAQYIVDLGLGTFAFLSSLAHSALTGIGANDHHNQSHDHSASGDGQALAPASTFALTGDITPSTLSGDVNDYDPTGWSTASVIRLESGSPSVRTITGLAGGADGRVAILINKGATFNVNLASESASSSAANRFSLGSSAFQLAPGRAIALIYDATASRWRPLVIHDHTQLSNIGNYAHSVLDAHRDDTANPHSTTLSQVSAFNDGEGDPAALGAAADGTSGYAARRDHVHATTQGEAVLGSSFSITGTAGTYQDTGLSVTLPSAGTYKITANVRAFLRGNAGTAWWIHCELFNSTDSAAVANSERLIVLTGTNSFIFQTTAPIDAIVTVAASKTIKLYAARNGNGSPSWTTSDITSDTNGRTNLMYEKIG